MISTFRTSDFQISGSAISSHKNIQEYKETSLDREIMNEISDMSIDEKQKLLQTIRIWK